MFLLKLENKCYIYQLINDYVASNDIVYDERTKARALAIFNDFINKANKNYFVTKISKRKRLIKRVIDIYLLNLEEYQNNLPNNIKEFRMLNRGVRIFYNICFMMKHGTYDDITRDDLHVNAMTTKAFFSWKDLPIERQKK